MRGFGTVCPAAQPMRPAAANTRGKRNESSYTLLVAQKLTEIYNLPLEEIAKITTENSKAVFGI